MQSRISVPFCAFAAAASIAACSASHQPSAPSEPPGEGTHLNAEALTLTTPTAAEPSEPMTLVASVASQTGSTFEFYNDGNGKVLYSEFGGEGVMPLRLNTQGLSPSQIWAQVAPGRPVPNALSAASGPDTTPAASTRPAVGSQRGTGPTSPPSGLFHTEGTSAPGDPNQFCSGAWAYNNLPVFKPACDGDYKYNWCWYDTGPGGWTQGNNVNRDNAAICDASSSSDILLNVDRDSGQGGASWSIPSHSWRWFGHYGGLCCAGFCNCGYNVHITYPGSWGDLQFAGGFDW